MLTLESAEKHLQEVRAELARLDKDREALIGLVRNYEDFLRLRSGDGQPHGVVISSDTAIPEDSDAPIGVPPPKPVPNKARLAKMSKREAALRVLQEAHGAEIHSMEVARRVGTLVSHKLNPKHPYSSGLDYQLYQLRDEGLIEKVPGKSAWRAIQSRV